MTDGPSERPADRDSALLASIVASSDDAIVSKDLEGTITSWNQSAERLFGYTAEEAIGRNISLIIPDDRLHEETEILRRIRRGERIQHFETIRRHKGGELLEISATISPVVDGSGAIVGASKIARDLRPSREAEEELRKADRLKDRFLATLSHELRNPLAAVAASLEVMRMADGDLDVIERASERIERQTRQLIRLVDDLLDVSRITHEKLELRTRMVDLRRILEDAAESAMPDIDQRGHTLVVEPPEPPVTFEADPERMTQVLANLLTNAALYTPSGGTISLTARPEEGEMVISVTDDGVGIPEGTQDTIFDMFTQAERSHVDGHAGLGIGLTIAESLVDLHGGTIDVESDGRGSTFTVRLPVRPDAVARERRGQPDDIPPPVGVRRVLIVDDNEAFLESVGLIVEKLGHEVRMADDGRRAVEVASEFEPDLVLMDLGMPGMNGFEAARILQEQPWSDKMTLVALTGWGQEKDKRATREAGFDHHMVKPARVEELRALLNGSPGRRDG